MDIPAELLEREQELNELQSLVRSTPEKPQLLMIEAAAGLGKTSLLGVAREWGREEGLCVLSARCSRLEQDFAFGTLIQLFERHTRGLPDKERAALFGGAAAPAKVLIEGSWDAPQYHSPSFAVLHGLYWLTVNLAAQQPLMIIIDDFQWSDLPSRQWVSYMSHRMQGQPVSMVLSFRTPGPDDAELVPLSTSDVLSTTLRLQPLSSRGTGRLLGHAFTDPVAAEFTAACYAQTDGNPLFLKELAATIRAMGITPDADHLDDLHAVSVKAVSRSVDLRMSMLNPSTHRLAHAIAVLPDSTDLEVAAEVAGLDSKTAAEDADSLREAAILRVDRDRLSFVHLIVRLAVVDQISRLQQEDLHSRAAEVLSARGESVEQIGTHLLHSSPGMVTGAKHILWTVARNALGRGAPDLALTYLNRALREALPAEERYATLVDAGNVARQVNASAAVAYFTEALSLLTRQEDRADLTVGLSISLVMSGRIAEAEIRLRQLISETPGDDSDTHRTVIAFLTTIALNEPNRDDLRKVAETARALPAHGGRASFIMNSALALGDAFAADPASIARARSALANISHRDELHEESDFATCAIHTLLAANPTEGTRILDEALALAHLKGGIKAMAAFYEFRALARLMQGSLSDAAADAEEAVRAIEAAGLDFRRSMTGPFSSEILLEQGRIADAQRMLAWVGVTDQLPPIGPWYYLLHMRSRLFQQAGEFDLALEASLASGRRFTACGGRNPAFLPWRSQVALCLHNLNRTGEAQEYLQEEIDYARRWGAPGPLGRALRVAGTLSGPQAIPLLEEAVAVLADSPARLEHAKALLELGAALRRSNRRSAARPHLREAIDIATTCGAAPTVQLAQLELLTAGAQRHHALAEGLQSLTPSERRIADMAARGASNRDIAQELFITPKTVEVHLSSVYRKLGISARTNLVAALSE